MVFMTPYGPAVTHRTGLTARSLLRHRRAGAGKCVAIYGTDGLAYIAIRIARATGAEVSVLNLVISATDRLWMGADHYFATRDPVTYRALEGAFDLIVCTLADADIKTCIGLLKCDGAILMLDTPTQVASPDFITRALAFCGI
jgi:alcohol dehydrogenase (NADP+)